MLRKYDISEPLYRATSKELLKKCGVDQTLPLTAAQPSDRNYNMYIIELHGLELEQSATD